MEKQPICPNYLDCRPCNAHCAGNHDSRFRTRLCEYFMRTGTCKYLSNCHFAHGPHELRCQHGLRCKERTTGHCTFLHPAFSEGTRVRFRLQYHDQHRQLITYKLYGEVACAGHECCCVHLEWHWFDEQCPYDMVQLLCARHRNQRCPDHPPSRLPKSVCIVGVRTSDLKQVKHDTSS